MAGNMPTLTNLSMEFRPCGKLVHKRKIHCNSNLSLVVRAALVLPDCGHAAPHKDGVTPSAVLQIDVHNSLSLVR